MTDWARLQASLDWFGLGWSLDRWDGSLIEASAGVDFFPWSHVGFGVGLSRHTYRLERFEDLGQRGSLRTSMDFATAYVSFVF